MGRELERGEGGEAQAPRLVLQSHVDAPRHSLAGPLALALLAPLLAPFRMWREASARDCPALYEACHSTLQALCLMDDRFCHDNGSFTGELLEHCLNVYEE